MRTSWVRELARCLLPVGRLRGALLMLLVCTTGAHAADTQAEKFAVDLDRQPLDVALQQLAKQSGIQVIFLSRVTQGLNAPAVHGELTLADALDKLLEGTQLTFRVINAQTVEIRSRPTKSTAPPKPTTTVERRSTPTSESAQLEEVVVTGLAEQLVATRIPTPVWELPQTVSIISYEQIRLQNSVDLGDALRRATGVTLTRSSSLDGDFYMRGYLVPTLHIDGGAALNPAFLRVSQVSLVPADMSEYDHIEILRGSDALFSGIGSPGGTISLVRKKPEPNYAFGATATLGSWDSYRAELDITGPIAFDTALRGRAVVTTSQRDYFYDSASAERTKVFAALAYDVTPNATLTFGGSYQRDDAKPFLSGVPSYADGSDPKLSRDTSLVFDWQQQPTRNTEAYAQYHQDFAGDWSLKMNVTHWRSEAELAEGSFDGLIDPATHGVPAPISQFSVVPSTATLDTADVTVTGVFNWLGWREEFAIGADASRLRSRSQYQFFQSDTPLADIREFDPAAYPDPRLTDVPYFQSKNRSTAERYGAFTSLRVYFNDVWSVVGGVRIGTDTFDSAQQATRATGTSVSSARSANRNILTPYASAMVAITEHYSLYASYADVYNTMASFAGPDGYPLDESHGVNMEAGIKGHWRNGAINGLLSLYRIDSKDSERIVAPRAPGSVRRGGICCFVTADGKSQGVDLELNGALAPDWKIGIGYTYNENEGADGSVLSMLTPPHLFKAWTSVALSGALRRWTIGGDLYAQSANRVETVYCSDIDCADVAATQRGYAVLALRAGFEINPNWQVALLLNNALDETYYESIGSPALHRWYGEPRNWTLRLDGRY
jgi:outer-membrane receptor for ferric coprogen and ferric-rhodotorulic acid